MSNRKRVKKNSNSLVDVVVVCGGRFDMLRKCLKALEVQEDAPPFQVFVIDNATDNVERLNNKGIFEMEIVTESKRLVQEEGFPKSSNIGARMGTSSLILFLNDDVALRPSAIKELVSTMDNPEVGIVGAKLLFPDDSTSSIRPPGKVQHVGLGMTINGDIIHPLVGWRADHPKCNISRDVIGVTGACLMVRRNLFKQVDGFWEGYGAGSYEDCDLCMSILYMQKRVIINTAAIGTHYTGATSEKKQRGYPYQQNARIFGARWGQTGLFRWSDKDFY